MPRIFDEAALRSRFEVFGAVSEVIVIRDRFGGAHKGAAFVTFADSTAAQLCIDSLHGKVALDGVSDALALTPSSHAPRMRAPCAPVRSPLLPSK